MEIIIQISVEAVYGDVVSPVGRVVKGLALAARPPAASTVDHRLPGRYFGPLLSGNQQRVPFYLCLLHLSTQCLVALQMARDRTIRHHQPLKFCALDSHRLEKHLNLFSSAARFIMENIASGRPVPTFCKMEGGCVLNRLMCRWLPFAGVSDFSCRLRENCWGREWDGKILFQCIFEEPASRTSSLKQQEPACLEDIQTP